MTTSTTTSTTTPIAASALAATADAGLQAVGAPTVADGSTVLTVGVGEEFATLSAAINASHNGDTILVNAGTYTNDFATIRTNITIEGVGGMVNLVATVPPPNLKGILTVDNNVTIENVSFSGSAIDDADGGNGAGIRYEGGNMVLENDAFSNNQDGILAFPAIPTLTSNTISIDHCLFQDNGSGSGYTHNLYIGGVDSLTFTNNVTEGAVVGHEFKSRALVNTIENNVFRDGPTGTASYDIDLPNGGKDLIANNVIEKGPDAENNTMVHFGGEGIPYVGSSLTVTGNAFIGDPGTQAVGVTNQTSISATINGNAFNGISSIVNGPATGTGNVDGTGNALPNFTLVGVLPGNTQIFTDAAAHSVVLDNNGEAVEGGGGLLTVNDATGHVIALGGAGGMNLVEAAGAGGSSFSTLAGSVNSLTLTGQDTIDSEGTDTIQVGAGNVSGDIGGDATVTCSSGDNVWSITGKANFVAGGGNVVLTLGAGAALGITGSALYAAVQDNGGSVSIDLMQSDGEQQMAISGGAAVIQVYQASLSVSTAAGNVGNTIWLGAGTATVLSLGPDIIHAGSGDDTVIVTGAATVYAGTGTLALFGRGDTVGATFYGHGGTYTIDGDTGNITYYGGALASTVISTLSRDTMIGGAGHMTIDGGCAETIIGGSGGITVNEDANSGANTITTAAGSTNLLNLVGSDTVYSYGTDTINAGNCNQVITAYGTTLINGGTGNSTISLFGTDKFVGRGSDNVMVNAGAVATVVAGVSTNVSETDGKVYYYIKTGANAGQVVLASNGHGDSGGTISGGTGSAMQVSTAQGQSTLVTLCSGNATVYLNGADTVHAQTGSETIVIGAGGTAIQGGAANLTIHNQDWAAVDKQTIYGGTGSMNYDQAVGMLKFIGGSGNTVIDGGSGSLYITGGSGNLTVSNGGLGLHFVAGSGTSNLALTPGGGSVTFGTGTTNAQVAGWGAADVFNAVAGSGGGHDMITGFRVGTDHLHLSGVSVASTAISGGSAMLTLSDHTQVTLAGVTDTSHVFG